MTASTEHRGITLLEVLVALVVLGVSVASARAIAEQIAGAGRASARVVDARLRERARAEELRRTFALAAAPRDSSEVFDGLVNDASFSTRCADTRGLDVSCRCRVFAQTADAGRAVVARACTAGTMPDTLVSDSLGLRMIYLVDAANGGRWISEWRKTNSLPRAVGFIRYGRGDTLIARIGERG